MGIMIIKRSEMIEREEGRIRKVADKLIRSQLGKLADEMSIPGKELNLIAKEVVGREFGDYRFLTSRECRKVMGYLKKNYDALASRYRRLMWS